MTSYDYEKKKEPLVLSKETIDILLKDENPSEVISLYVFYYYTAKWQETSIARATADYCSMGMKMSVNKIRAVKGRLEKLGLIESIVKRDDMGLVVGHYVKVNFVSFIHPTDYPQGGLVHRVDFCTPNALNTNNINALNTNNINTSDSSSLQTEGKENKKRKANDFDLSCYGDNLKEPLSLWLDYKTERKEIYKSAKSIDKIAENLKKLCGDDTKKMLYLVNNAIEKNWKGIYNVEYVKVAESKNASSHTSYLDMEVSI